MTRPRSKYTLSSMLLLATCICVMVATTQSAVSQWDDDVAARGLMVGGGLFGAIAGTLFGIASGRYLLGSFAGLLVGTIAGAMAGAQLASPPNFFTTIIGVVALLGLAFALRPRIDRKNPDDDDEKIVVG